MFKHWDKLSGEVLESPSLDVFQTCLGAALLNLGFGSVVTRVVTGAGLKRFSG